MRARVVTLVVCLLVAVFSPMLFSGGYADADMESKGDWTPSEKVKMLENLRKRFDESVPAHNSEIDFFSYTDGAFPVMNDDGTFGPIQPLADDWGDHYVSEIMYRPPNNLGGGFSMDITGSAGHIVVGDTHESFIGDQNSNDILEWISYYSYAPWGNDSKDNDGDGCVDEKTYGDWDNQTGCDMIPDQMVYFANGGLPDVGGKNGTLVAVADWYSEYMGVNVHRIFSMSPWDIFQIKVSAAQYPEVADAEDVISYYAHESDNGLNANPEVDSDMEDDYVASIDARGFPGKDPTNHVCFAGKRLYKGITSVLDNGSVIVSFGLQEWQDDRDWNGDGDKNDTVAAYYAVDPVTGDCDQGVNLGVYGMYPKTRGLVLTPATTFETADSRDWNGDGDMDDAVLLWHDVNSSLSLIGHRYTSSSFTDKPGKFGNGYWGRYTDSMMVHRFTVPLNSGGAWFEYGIPSGGGNQSKETYHTYFFLTADDDGDPQTGMPKYHAGYGKPSASLAGVCIQLYAREGYLNESGVKLIGGRADGNGDGDLGDTLNSIFCPNQTGGGEFIVEPTSKFAKGLYEDPIPFIWIGNKYYESTGEFGGIVANPTFYEETEVDDDANGNLEIERVYNHGCYWITLEEEDKGIIGGGWLGSPIVQPGGTVLGQITLSGGGSSVFLNEDTSIFVQENYGIGPLYAGENYAIQGLHVEDSGNGDGILDPNEIATIYFTLRVSAMVPTGPMTVTIHVLVGGATLKTDLTLPVSSKMFGKELSCYRHRQAALRAIRAFDMDDDWGMLHDLVQGKYVNLAKYGAGKMEPEEAVYQLILWYETGCKKKGKGGVEVAHSAGMMLTDTYGMGTAYWGFIPGQEEGNEGNGNGGLTGRDRKTVYGF
ncbi:MAG: hypothetical protein JSV43_06285 [Methanobacteriota archaeon]|nr:MAG: hypothetical protein JSV43_06285 [Euryarchaeota archaeon]